MEYSLGMFYTQLKVILGTDSNKKAGSKQPKKNSIKDNENFRELVQNTEELIARSAVHPKFERVAELVS